MIATLEPVTTMAKSLKDTKRQESSKKATAKVEVALLNKARIFCIGTERNLQDYIDGILRPVIERDYEGFIKR